MPREFLTYTALNALPLKLRPLLNTLLNWTLRLMDLSSFLEWSGNELLASLASPGIQDLPPTLGRHSRPEAMSSGSGQVAWLKRSLHSLRRSPRELRLDEGRMSPTVFNVASPKAGTRLRRTWKLANVRLSVKYLLQMNIGSNCFQQPSLCSWKRFTNLLNVNPLFAKETVHYCVDKLCFLLYDNVLSFS